MKANEKQNMVIVRHRRPDASMSILAESFQLVSRENTKQEIFLRA